jgi:short-subunit dehydrogenase
MTSNLLRYGTTALITGASSGIGAAFCRRIAQEGYSTIVAVARRSERLEELQREIEATTSSTVIPIVLDLEKYGSSDALASQLARRGIVVDLVVNNAGFGLLGALETIDRARLVGMVDLNCRAVVDIAAQFIPGMKERRRGAMIITSSVVGAIPTPWFSVYSATKAFDLYLGEALHAECRGSGVDILTVLPGLTRTEFQAGAGMRQYHSPYRSAEQVVDTACAALGKRSIVVDGALNKFLVHGTRFLPRCVMLVLSRFVMKMELR